MAKTKEQKHREVFDQAYREFDASYSASEEERRQALEDRRFYSIAGAM